MERPLLPLDFLERQESNDRHRGGSFLRRAVQHPVELLAARPGDRDPADGPCLLCRIAPVHPRSHSRRHTDLAGAVPATSARRAYVTTHVTTFSMGGSITGAGVCH